jgi:hypothetical protein
MYLLLRILGALALLALAVFCLLGFVENPAWGWKLGYAVLGLVAITASLRLFRQAKRP